MKRETKQLKNRTTKGRLNFCVTLQGRFLGVRKTANSVAEMIEKANKRWGTLEFRNDLGQRILINREFMEQADYEIEAWTADEVIQDWLENASESELEERIRAMGPEFGVTLEW